MKQLLFRFKLIGIMLIWDFLTAIVLGVFAYIVIGQMNALSSRVIVGALTILFVIIMMRMKYVLNYKQYGRDDVTGGKNRKEFERIAKDLLKGDGRYVLVYANVDRFKLINENYGSEVGDKVLRQIHTIIDEELRWDEVSGRIMADNFGMLMRYHSLPKLDQRFVSY